MKLAITNSSTNPINHYLTDAIVRAAKKHKDIDKVLAVPPYELARALKDVESCSVLVVDGQVANTNQISQSIGYSSGSAVWFFEDPYDLENNVRRASMFDEVFTTDDNSSYQYEGAEYLPLAADPEVCYFPVRRQWQFDLCFVGVAWPNRVQELLALKDQFPSLRWNVRLVTNGSIHPVLLRDGLVDKIHRAGWILSPDTIGIRDLAALSNRSRITLCLPRRFSLNPKKPLASSSSPPPRIFEVAMAGGAQIVSSQSVAGKTNPFSEGALLTYGDEDALADRVEHLLANDKLVYEVARIAQEECRLKHTYLHRLSKITEKLTAVRCSSSKRSNSSLRKNILQAPESILIVSHNRVGTKYFGGVEVFSSELFNELTLARKFLAAPAADGSGLYLITDSKGQVVASLPMINDQGPFYYQDSRVEKWLEEFVIQHRIANIFFCHLINWPLSLVSRMATLGIKIILKLNEFYYICPSINLQSFANVYCNMPRLGQRACDSCLYQMTGAGYGTFAQRLNIMGKALSDVDVLIAPSISTKEIYESVFSDLRGKIMVMPYFLPRREPRPCSRRGDKLRVLIAGMISRHKGGFDLRTVMDQLPDDDIEFHICGDLVPDIKAMLDPLLTSRRNITFHGPYLPGELPRPFYECDVALFLSIWPETYLIALTEAMRAGCVPIVTSIGAHGDRIVHGENGFKVEVGDPSAVVRTLRGLLVDRTPLAGMKLRSQSTPTTSVADYVAFLQAHLDGGLTALSRPEGLGGQVLANVDLGISMPAAAAAPPPIQRRSALFYSRRLWSIYKSEGAEVALKKIVSYGHARLRTRIARSA